MALTLKGQAAYIVDGLRGQLPSKFAALERTLDYHRSLYGGTTAVNALAYAAAVFNKHCEMLQAAQRIYASMSGPEKEEDAD